MASKSIAHGRESALAGRSKSSVALLILDMVSTWEFPDGQTLMRRAERITANVAALRNRCTTAGVPVIFANDNFGHWRSDFRLVVATSLERGGAAAAITRLLAPDENDFCVLKPKHSAFLATPLELLLRHLGVRRVVVTGVSSDQCVLNTVADAHMRELEVEVASDCIASLSQARHRRALRHFEEVLKVPVKPGRSIRL
jgi:nicotinamidase-related amidase